MTTENFTATYCSNLNLCLSINSLKSRDQNNYI